MCGSREYISGDGRRAGHAVVEVVLRDRTACVLSVRFHAGDSLPQRRLGLRCKALKQIGIIMVMKEVLTYRFASRQRNILKLYSTPFPSGHAALIYPLQLFLTTSQFFVSLFMFCFFFHTLNQRFAGQSAPYTVVPPLGNSNTR